MVRNDQREQNSRSEPSHSLPIMHTTRQVFVNAFLFFPRCYRQQMKTSLSLVVTPFAINNLLGYCFGLACFCLASFLSPFWTCGLRADRGWRLTVP